MAPTRHVEIFQDPANADQPNMGLHQNTLPVVLNLPDEDAQRALISANHDIIFNPPSSGSSGRSPLKSLRQPSTTPPKANIPNIHISLPPPLPPTFKTDSPVKRPAVNLFPIAPPKTAMPMFSSFPCSSLADKENRAPSFHSDNIAEFPDPSYGYQPSLKRPFSVVELPQESNSKKARCEDQSQTELPDPQSLPSLEDDGNKPQFSYASLIGMAILRSPERKLTLAQIYKWISDSFAHYRKANDSGWQNSIRHNLSLNKAFIKQERPKDDPGKGNYWAIKPGCESQFFHKEKGSRRPPSSSSAGLKPSSQPPSSEANAQPTLPQLPTKSAPHAKVQTKEPSSDATVPASDAPSSPDGEEKVTAPRASRQPQSSPVQDIRSSPPSLPENREDTPSPIMDLDLPSFNRPGKRKRKHTEMDDSGYFSSLDSSVTRPYPEPKLPRLDVSRQKMKRGRAEEEIARMRSSSHDFSPSRVRSFMKQLTPSLVSSSPLRSLDTALMPPPLTPAVNMRLPLKPPPSVSPNTNLRIHRNKIRELVGSPVRQPISDEPLYSPRFKIVEEETCGYENGLDSGFSLFNDDNHSAMCRPAASSPTKRSTRRTDQARKTSNILADITCAGHNRISLGGLEAPESDSPLRQKPFKSPLCFGNTFNEIPNEDLFGVDFLDDEEPDDFGGLDILQGFSKIGSNKPSEAPMAKGSRPHSGARSHTSLF